MPEFVRVRLENGAEASVPEAVAEGAGLKPLKKDAHLADGTVAPTKLRVSNGAASADNINPETSPVSDAPKEG